MKLLNRIHKKNILVVGDVMLDTYYTGEVRRISPEAPVPVFKKQGERYALGGAANVAANLAAAGQAVSIMALIGDDSYGKRMKELFSETGVNDSLISIWDRPTITKTRFLAENNQQVLRLDVEEGQKISEDVSERLFSTFESVVDDFDMILLSDYMKGLLTDGFTQKIIGAAKLYGKKVLVDVKDPAFEKYKGAYLLKPNQKELQSLTKMPVSTNEKIIEAAQYLMERAESDYVLTTCGAKGMLLVGKGIVYRLDTAGKSVYDVTGAGDTTIAYLTAGLANGMHITEAMKLSNFAAGIQVGKVGTSAVHLHEVEKTIHEGTGYKRKKVFRMNERKALAELLAQWKDAGETVVTTNGCFDIIHRGHISLLEEAKKYGDHLVVMINADVSVKRLKGKNRPINTEEDRATVIAALDCVDAVMVFDPLMDNGMVTEAEIGRFTPELRKIAQEAPMGAVKFIAPDVHIKGGDYSADQVPEAVFAKKFFPVSFIEGYSTTKTIEKSRVQ